MSTTVLTDNNVTVMINTGKSTTVTAGADVGETINRALEALGLDPNSYVDNRILGVNAAGGSTVYRSEPVSNDTTYVVDRERSNG